MPKNGFFFLFMAPVMTRGREGTGRKPRSEAKKTPPTTPASQQEERVGPASPAPRKQSSRTARSPAHSAYPGRTFLKSDFRLRLWRGRVGGACAGAPERGEVCGRPCWGPAGATSSCRNPAGPQSRAWGIFTYCMLPTHFRGDPPVRRDPWAPPCLSQPNRQGRRSIRPSHSRRPSPRGRASHV